ncbi:hypothetical protein KFE98_16770 [bacterium SCSIO 12741]|nr:hypothetical protein KFE98_16770 [bacterium SCSIO 12741]
MSFKLLIIILAALICGSCSQQKGCTDPDAANWDLKAKKDDGSCVYHGDVHIVTTQSLDDNHKLYLKVDGRGLGYLINHCYTDQSVACDPEGCSVGYFTDNLEGTYQVTAWKLQYNDLDDQWDTIGTIGPQSFTVLPKTCQAVILN